MADLELEIPLRALPLGLHDDLIPFMVYNIVIFREFGYSLLPCGGWQQVQIQQGDALWKRQQWRPSLTTRF